MGPQVSLNEEIEVMVKQILLQKKVTVKATEENITKIDCHNQVL